MFCKTDDGSRITFIFIELPKSSKSIDELDGNILEGMYFCFKNMTVLDERPGVLDHQIFRRIFEVTELYNMDQITRNIVLGKMNVNVLFKTNNLEIITRAADVLGVPFALLVGYVDQPDIDELPTPASDDEEFKSNEIGIQPEDIPTGDTLEDMRERQEIIKQFYFYWKKRNPDLCKYNVDLGEMIYINHTSLIETAGRASLTYLSTLAVLQLDAILQNAELRFVDKPKPSNKHQAKFEKMLGMNYSCPGIGDIRLM